MKTFAEYDALANRTRNNSEDAILNASLGLSGETGELVELVKKQRFHGRDVPLESFIKEMGDVLFYLAWIAKIKGVTLDEVAEQNIEKLKARYPDGFKLGNGADR